MSYLSNFPNLLVIGFVAAKSNSGKTTLIEKIIPQLKKNNLKIAVVKHSHHQIETDTKGKDSYRFNQAGADMVLLDAPNRRAITINKPHQADSNKPKLELKNLLKNLDLLEIDLIIVEGFKHEAYNKIEVFRQGYNQHPLAINDENIIAICTDSVKSLGVNCPQLNLNQTKEIVDFIITLKSRT